MKNLVSGKTKHFSKHLLFNCMKWFAKHATHNIHTVHTYIHIYSFHKCCLSGRGLYGRNLLRSWESRSSNSPSPPLFSSKCDISSLLAYIIYFVWSQNVPILGLLFAAFDTNIVVSSFIAFARFSITSLTHSTVSMSASTNSPAPTVAKRLNDWQEGSLALLIALWSQRVQMWRQMRDPFSHPACLAAREGKQTRQFIYWAINQFICYHDRPIEIDFFFLKRS